jgi:carbamoyltransferase
VANNKFILGINGGVRHGYQDISAVLMKDGKAVAAIEEERLTRIKHSPGQLPILSILEVLRMGKISMNEISVLAFHGSTWEKGIELILQSHFMNHFGFCPPIKRYHHHQCHAASAFYPSGFNEALVITVDGSGDGISTQISVGRNGKLELIKQYPRPQSLGMFYSIFTQICGFTRDADEYKLMGLSAFGNPSVINLNEVLLVDENGYRFNEDYMVTILPGQSSPTRHEILYNQKLEERLNVSRRINKEITEQYKNIAAAAQNKIEEAMVSLVKKYVNETGINKVCLAGGVALNCLANQKIEELNEVKELFVQPASTDAGISLGAAYLASLDEGVVSFEKHNHVYWGNSFSDETIESTLIKCQLVYEKIDALVISAADDLANGKVIGWFQGKMEFGPRALGNRSILASPTTKNIQHIVNEKIKFREGFRPFGASVLAEDFQTYFHSNSQEASYMTKVFNVKKNFKDLLAGVTHVDGTSRVQTVNQNQNPLYYSLLLALKAQCGHGVLLNTSFNLNHEPIVNTPREAIASFFASGMDSLYIGNYRLTK